MKTRQLTLAALALCAATSLLSCEKTTDNGNSAPSESTLSGVLSSDLTLKSGATYSLSGGFHVPSGKTLTIESGVRIVAKDDNIVDYILVEQGGKIKAEGTATNPIVMSAEREEPGAWGGVHICGKAPINVTGATSKSEIGDATYGGTDADDNSGTLRYIRLEYTGYAFSEEKEANGFTFYGVGRGTKVEYLQSYKGSDDGFEWFGGTVNCRYLVSTDNTDDSFDWTEGWQGKGQFWVAHQISAECDCLVEADNNSKDAAANPVSHPTLSNLTLVGNSSSTAKRGIRLRAGTEAEIYNTLVTGKPDCLTTETAETENSLKNGTSKVEHTLLAGAIGCKEGIYSEEAFLAAALGNSVNAQFSLTDTYIGTVDSGKDLASDDSFFVSAPYKGAVKADNDWTKGWTRK